MKKPQVVVAHAGFLPERKKSLQRLYDQLQEAGWPLPVIFTSAEKEHAKVWATRIWDYVANVCEDDQERPHIILNDDLFIHPRLCDVVTMMTKALPGKLLALHAQHPQAVELASRGFNWFRCYWYTGPGVVLYSAQAKDLLEFSKEPKNQSLWAGNEDNMAIHWAYARQTPFFTSLPAVVKHDVTVPSTLGYDDHPMRVATVLWDNKEFAGQQQAMLTEDFWTPVGEVPFVENPWAKTDMLDAFKKGAHLCSFCNVNIAVARSDRTKVGICRVCLSGCVEAALLQQNTPA